MGKIIKFGEKNNQEPKETEINKKENLSPEIEKEALKKVPLSEEEKIKEAVEQHLLTNFAVKKVLKLEIVYKIRNGEIGVVGILAYEHKRRPGIFNANFIAKGYQDKKSGDFTISTLAFEAGEPDLFISIYNTLKAKKLLPIE